MLNGVRLGDQESWRALVHIYWPLVHARCRSAVFDAHDAEEILQEVFRVVFEKIEEFRKPSTDTEGTSRPRFRSWLFAILRNKIGDYIRYRAREPRPEGGSDALLELNQVCAGTLSDDDVFDEEDARRILCHRVMDLVRREVHNKTWDAFRFYAIEGMSAAAFAEKLQIKLGAVYVAKTRVRGRIRSILEEFGERFADEATGDDP